MKYFIYILYSHKYHKNYVGMTSNLEQRMISHNQLGTKGYTPKFRPWTIVHSEEFETKQKALAKEKFYKSGQGRKVKMKIIEEYLNNKKQ